MTSGLEQLGRHVLFDGLDAWATLAGLVLLRTTALVMSAPLPGELVPLPVRGAFGVILAVAMTPVATTALGAAGALTGASLVAAAMGEVVLGVVYGFIVRLGLATVDAAGQLIGMQMGIGFGGMIDPMMGQEVTATGRLLAATAMLAFVVCGGLTAMLAALADSLVALPPGSFGVEALLRASGPEVLGAMVRLFPTALQLAAPVMGLLLGTNACLALLTRAAAGLNVFSLSFVVSIVVGLYALRSVEPAVLGAMRDLAEGLRERLLAIALGSTLG